MFKIRQNKNQVYNNTQKVLYFRHFSQIQRQHRISPWCTRQSQNALQQVNNWIPKVSRSADLYWFLYSHTSPDVSTESTAEHEIMILHNRINYSNGFSPSPGNFYGSSRGLVDNGSNGIPLNPLISYSGNANQSQTQHSTSSAMDH